MRLVLVQRKQVVAGVGETEASIKSGKNNHCRSFSYAGGSFSHQKSTQTIQLDSADLETKDGFDFPYQKITTLNHACTLLAVGTTDNRVHILTYPELEALGDVLQTSSKSTSQDSGDVVAIDFSHDGAWLAVTFERAIRLYSIALPEPHAEAATTPWQVRQTISPPAGLDVNPVTFKSAKFSRAAPTAIERHPTIHAILNSSPPKTGPGAGGGLRRRSGGSAREKPVKKAYAVNFALVQQKSQPGSPSNSKGKGKAAEAADDNTPQDLGPWDVVARRELGTKPVTGLDVSHDGTLVAYALSDYSLGILDATTLTPLLKILHAHSFAITDLAFNPSGTLLASAGADNTVRIVVVPQSFGCESQADISADQHFTNRAAHPSASTMTLLACLLALILALVALYVQRGNLLSR